MPFRLATLAVLALSLAMPSRARAQERAFGPGEAVAYSCSYLGVRVGTIQVVVGSPTPVMGRSVWPIMGVGRTESFFLVYPVHDRYVAWWDPKERIPVGTDMQANENHRTRRERVRFHRGKNQATTTREKEGKKESVDYEVHPGALDVLSALYAIRTRPLNVGDHEELPVFTGKKSFTMKVDVDRKEPVETKVGRFEAKVLKVQVGFSGKLASKREMMVHVTDDPRHLFLRLDAEFLLGSLVAELVEYEKGVSP